MHVIIYNNCSHKKQLQSVFICQFISVTNICILNSYLSVFAVDPCKHFLLKIHILFIQSSVGVSSNGGFLQRLQKALGFTGKLKYSKYVSVFGRHVNMPVNPWSFCYNL